MKQGDKNILNYKRKNRIKVLRVTLQILFLTVIASIFLKTLIYDGRYRQTDTKNWESQNGFVALSFPEVTRLEKPAKIMKTQFDKYLNYLRRAGFTSISQEDILKFYGENGKLPNKSLFLMIDSASKNSVQFAQPILDKYQYKASILTYGSVLENEENSNISLKDIAALKKTGFWEFGTNGYRLAYINVFGKDSSFAPILYPEEFMGAEKTTYYNHYLMDFIRNKYMIPVETRKEMEERVNNDYGLMESAYKNYFGFMPDLYVLMNANSPYYGSNKMTGDVNLSNIKRLFKMSFNKEGSGLNTKERDIYDLTRIQVDPNWPMNHFVTRIKKDSKDDIDFATGKKSFWEKWDEIKGAAEFDGNKIVLTSPQGEEGKIYLKGSENYGDIKINTTISSNIQGRLSFYLKCDSEAQSYIRVTFHDNNILIEQKIPESINITKVLEKTLDSKDNQLRDINISLKNNTITVMSDSAVVADSVEFDSNIDQSGIALSSKYDEEQLGDKIYDSVFTDLHISKEVKTAEGKEQILYDNRYTILDKVTNSIKFGCDFIINWFIEKF